MARRWIRRPEGSNWGEFGDDDELGRLNLLTPEKVRQGVAEVIEGKSFCLSIPLDYPGGAGIFPMRPAPVINPTVLDGKRAFNLVPRPPSSDVLNDDVVLLCLQYSTQWDSLCHMGSRFDADGDGKPETVFYNGYRAGEHVVGGGEGPHVGALKLGIEKMAAKAIQGRAVLIDLKAHFGEALHEVSYADLAAVMKKDKVVVEPGDMVCLHTGLADLILSMNKNPDPEKIFGSCAVLDGSDPKLLDWIRESGLSALIADNVGVESSQGHGRGAQGRCHAHADPRALPVQARRALGRALAFRPACRLAARAQAQSLPLDRATALSAPCRGLAGHAGGDGLTAAQ